MHIFFLNLFFAVLFFCSNANAKSYFTASEIAPALLDRPLEQNSAEYKKEIEQIIRLQKSAKKSEIAAANFEAHLSLEMMIKNFDPKLLSQDFPRVQKLLEKTLETVIESSENAKQFWHTKRPYLLDKRVISLVEKVDNHSYPSGHTASSFIMAKVLTLLLPQKNADFVKEAEIIANHRVLAGVHFPHDLEGGRQLGMLILGSLIENQEFLEDLKKAKEEIARFY